MKSFTRWMLFSLLVNILTLPPNAWAQSTIEDTGAGKGKTPELTTAVIGIDIPEPLRGEIKKMLQQNMHAHLFVKDQDNQCNPILAKTNIVCVTLGPLEQGQSSDVASSGWNSSSKYRPNSYRSDYDSGTGYYSGTIYRTTIYVRLLRKDGEDVSLGNGWAIAGAGVSSGSSCDTTFKQASRLNRGGSQGYGGCSSATTYTTPEMAYFAAGKGAADRLFNKHWYNWGLGRGAQWDANAQEKITGVFGRN